MDAKAEFQKVVKDVAASAREFAAQGLSYTSRALEVAGATLKRAELSLKTQAEKLHPDKAEKAAEPAAAGSGSSTGNGQK